jgi:hypothetical protein
MERLDNLTTERRREFRTPSTLQEFAAVSGRGLEDKLNIGMTDGLLVRSCHRLQLAV